MSRSKRSHHWALLFVALAILAYGLVFIRSASFNVATGTYGPYMWMQLAGGVVGAMVAMAIASLPYRWILGRAWEIYGLLLLLLVAVLAVGHTVGGATRWLRVGPLNLQPSELMKVGLVVVLARYLASHRLDRARDLVAPLLVVGLPIGLVLLQPDLGTALSLLPVLFALLYAAGARRRHLTALVATGLALAPVAWLFVLKPYQKMRLTAFLSPETAPPWAIYQAKQSYIAVGAGGLYGRGWGEGTQTRLNFLPERHTDFIFSVVCEEWGLVGGLGVLVLYAVLLLLILEVAHAARDRAGQLICVGVAVHYAFQVVQNVGMAIGLAPITGLTLPFLSYGRSSLLASFIGLGLVLSVHRHRTSRVRR